MPPETQWGSLLAIVGFVVASSLIMGWIGWTRRDK